jgi:hypothetical protein
VRGRGCAERVSGPRVERERAVGQHFPAPIAHARKMITMFGRASGALTRSAGWCRSIPGLWCRVQGPRPRPEPTNRVLGYLAGDAPDEKIRYPAGTGLAQCSALARLEVCRRPARAGQEPPSAVDILL